MAGPLRTRRLYAGVVAPGNDAIAQVPAGERWLLTDVRMEALGASTYFGLYSVDGLVTYSILTGFNPPEYTTQSLTNAFVVLDEGEILTTYAEVCDHSVMLSGHVFVVS